MKRISLLLVVFLSMLEIKAQNDSIWNQPYSLELQIGQLGNLQKQPLLWDALDGFYLRRGNDVGLRFSARISIHFSIVTRYKLGLYGSNEFKIKEAIIKADPNYLYSVNTFYWTMHQLHTGVAYRIPKNRWCFEAEQYVGLSIIDAPFLSIRGKSGDQDTIHRLFIRQYQQVPAASLYTAVSAKYFLARRVYVSGRVELGVHFPLNPLETHAVFGMPDERRNTPDPIFQLSGQFGVGWIFGKPMSEKFFKRKKQKDRF